jgi:hypothetical protein
MFAKNETLRHWEHGTRQPEGPRARISSSSTGRRKQFSERFGLREQISRGKMVFRPDQHESIHDFDLHRVDQPIAAVEVTSVTDGQVRSTHAAISRMRLIPRRLC